MAWVAGETDSALAQGNSGECMSTRQGLQHSPLHRSAFRRLWLGLVISRLGDQFTIIALVWFVLQLTGSGIAIGLVVFCFQLPTILSSPLK
jgi:Transmembrane secretion effector